MKPSSFIIAFVLLLLSFKIKAQGLIIPSGGYVIAGNGNIVLNSNWVNNGSFTHNSGAVVFAGSAQTLSGSAATTFNNLTTLAGSTTTVASPGHLLKGVLLSNGTLNANGNLTLLSTAAQTAAVDGSGAGEVLGNLIVQRYIASGFGYKYVSSPFQSDTVGDFSNDMNLSASFPTFYKFDESLASNGWVTYTGTGGVLSKQYGYAANLGSSASPKTIDLRGVVNNHGISINLYNHNTAYTQGFNLVGNPYPSPINWDAATGWTKTNIDNAVYYFNAGTTNQYTGVYSSYINGVSSDGVAGSTITAMQGFFVHVTNGTYPVAGLLGINNGVRILNATASFYRAGGQDGPPLLRLNAGFADQTSLADPVTFYFTDDANGVFNRKLDALKLMNTDSLVPSLFAVSKDAAKLSIQALAVPHDTFAVVPLGIVTKKDGWITFQAKDIQQMPAGIYIYLSDRQTGVQQDLQQDPQYRLYLPSGEYENRFFLQFATKQAAVTTVNASTGEAFSAYSTGGRLFVNAHLAPGQTGSLLVASMAGQVICRQSISGSVYQPVPANFAAGVYVVSFYGADKQQTKKVFIGDR